ncbi:MAG: tyrosine--tRNA ligase [Planctomycetota bacterium]|jgi:tyrosyl-tRNA synthetase|nr:tyrosine--tRNA ligase [Planctomycetota bacterium]
MSVTADLFQVLNERGMVAQSTDEAISERLAKPCVGYIGFDPTADSLHVGSLVPIMGLAWMQRCGHRPLVVVGGATALIGDPSGKSEMRKMLSRDDVAANAAAIGDQIGRVVRFGDDATGAALLNNADWLADRSWIDFLREVGPHFSVNRMLTMDSVKGRMEASGISFLEFNYMVMQAYDFLHLQRSHGCTLQMGGQDQWGNIVMGIELGRRIAEVSLAGLTMPLVTKADGGKFGKSEAGNIWLSADRTPVYQFYQFWRNVADADVGRFLSFFTFLEMDQVNQLASAEGRAINESKEVLAFEITKLVHGEAAAQQAQADAQKAFSASADVTGDSIPHAAIAASELEAGIGILALLVRAELAKSNSEARRLVQGGGVRIHDARIDDPTHTVTTAALQDGYLLLRAGKKRLYRFDLEA